MKDSSTQSQHDQTGDAGPSPDRPAVSHNPKQRKMVRKGYRAWARVSIRSFMARRGVSPDGCRTEQDGVRDPDGELEP